jgi:hypothetical protein
MNQTGGHTIQKYVGNIKMKKTLIALTVAGLGFAARRSGRRRSVCRRDLAGHRQEGHHSELVVTPLSSLSFQYAEGIKGSTPSTACSMSPSRVMPARPTSP